MAEQQSIRLCKRGHPQTEANICRSKTGENKGCRLCARIIVAAWNEKNRERSNKLSKERYYKNKDQHNKRVKRRKLIKEYGLTEEQYLALIKKQDNKCAICFQPPKQRSLHVDHIHGTSITRGLLCGNCNWGIGLFKDNPKLFMNAITYLSVGTIS